MQREDDIVQLHWVHAGGMQLEVVLLDRSHPVEADVEHAVEHEADHVQREEVKI